MKVNISLSVELDEVPLKVSATLAENYDALKSGTELIAESSNSLIIDDDVETSLSQITSAQKKIYDVFHNLENMKQLLIGYQKIQLDTRYNSNEQLTLPLDEEDEDV